MDLRRKLEIVEQAIKSIATHDDEDSVVVAAALDRVDQMTQAERERLSEKHAVALERLTAKKG